MGDNAHAPVSGVVTRVKGDGTGIALGPEATWYTVSRWTEPGHQVPSVGDQVTLWLDRGMYVRRCAIQSASAAPNGPSNGNLLGGQAPAVSGLTSGRDRLIIRQVALKAAVRCAGYGSAPVLTEDVLSLAETFAAWLAMDGAPDRSEAARDG